MDDGKQHCLICGGELFWQNDFSLEDYGYDDDEDGIVTVWQCSRCGRLYEIRDPLKEERDGEYRNFWHGDDLNILDSDSQ